MESRKNILKLSRSQWISVAVLASSLGLAIAVTIPNSFTAGTTISATQMNANFTALGTAVTTAETALAAAQTQITALNSTQPAVKSFQTTPSIIPTAAEGDLKTFTVTTPGAGQVVITMSGWFRFAHVTNIPVTGSFVSLFARQGATKFRAVTDAVPPEYPSHNPTIHTFSFTAAFPVAAAGAHDIIVSGLSNVGVDWGDCGAAVNGCPIVTLQYVPGTLP